MCVLIKNEYKTSKQTENEQFGSTEGLRPENHIGNKFLRGGIFLKLRTAPYNKTVFQRCNQILVVTQ